MIDTPLLAWQRAWRDGFAPLLNTKGLEGLLRAIERDDPRLIQGVTTDPPPIACMDHEAVEGCCGACWALLEGLPPYSRSVGELDTAFSYLVVAASELLGFDDNGARYFLNWFDGTPREEMRRLLSTEIRLELNNRATTQLHAVA